MKYRNCVNLGPLKTKRGEFRHRKNEDLYKSEGSKRISDTIRSRKVNLFGHIMRTDDSRVTKRIFSHVRKNKNDNHRAQGVKKEMTEMGITEDIIQDRTTFRELTHNFKCFQEKDNKKRNNICTEERRKKPKQQNEGYCKARTE